VRALVAVDARRQQERAERQPADEQGDRDTGQVDGERDAGMGEAGGDERGEDGAGAPRAVAAVEDRSADITLGGHGVGVHRRVCRAVYRTEDGKDSGQGGDAMYPTDERQQYRHHSKGHAQHRAAADPGDEGANRLHAGERGDGEQHAERAELTVGQVVYHLRRRYAHDVGRQGESIDEEDGGGGPAAGRGCHAQSTISRGRSSTGVRELTARPADCAARPGAAPNRLHEVRKPRRVVPPVTCSFSATSESRQT
jgi:hypothetical protein